MKPHNFRTWEEYDDYKKDAFRNGTLKTLAIMAFITGFLVLGCLFIAVAHTSEVEEIAICLAGEASGEQKYKGDETGLRAVASTAYNRAKAQKTTPYKALTAKNQYYGCKAKNRAKLYASVKPIADKIARELVSGTFKDITRGALYFRRPDEKLFKWCKVETFRYLNHIFYK